MAFFEMFLEKSLRIWIIEDDERISGFMKKGLEAEEHDVRVTLDGERGIELIQTASFDLIILDVYLSSKKWRAPHRRGRPSSMTAPCG